MAYPLQLIAKASVEGVRFGEVILPQGQDLRVGPGGQLALACPEGVAYLLIATWTGREVCVKTGIGDETRFGEDEEIDVSVGPVRVQLSVSPRFSVQRTTPVAVAGSAMWLMSVMAASLLAAQISLVVSQRCVWFGIDCPTPRDAVGSAWNTEFLARLVRKDYTGAEEGVIVADEPKLTQTSRHIYMPAGDRSEHTEQGGSDKVAPVARRKPARKARRQESGEREKPQLQAVAADGPVVIETERVVEAGETQKVHDLTKAEGTENVQREERAEEKLGWGLRDWMDLGSDERERVEMQMFGRIAQARARIDPDDPDALALLAYYQYLQEDVEAARETYDRLIELVPDSGAAYNNKALVYKREGRFEEEESLYRVALALDPNDTTVLNNLAVNLAHQNRFDEALKIMERLDVLLPNDPYSDLHRAKIYGSMGKIDKSLDYLALALQRLDHLDTLHHIEFRQDIRLDPSFDALRKDPRFFALLRSYYGEATPVDGSP